MPLVHVIDIDAPPPSLQDNLADLDRLRRAAAPAAAGTPIEVPLAQLPAVCKGFRAAGFRGCAVANHLPGRFEMVDFLPLRPEVLPLMALDLGSTHLEAALIDGLTGRELAHGDRENGQVRFADNILSRIHHAARNGGLEELHGAVVASINALAAGLARDAGIAPAAIRALSVAGNPTMVHLFLRLDPYHLCREPYIPLANTPDLCRAADLGLDLHPAAPVYVLPGVGSYFGGDLIAGILASGLDQGEGTSMLIDVGTNAEVVLGNREWLIACAGAAGPALEGGVARMGMRAGPGAVERVRIDRDSGRPRVSTIGDAPARGLCGSGIIDLVAELFLTGVIDLRGKFRPDPDNPRLVPGEGGLAYVVVGADEAAGGRPVVFEQVDLDAMMRSKAAMYAILTTIVGQVGLDFHDLDTIYVAGAFGRHIDPRMAITLGMLPDLPLETYEPVGNSSLAGARLVLTDDAARERCREIVRTITYVELNVNQEFMMRFSGSRFIPHTDRSLFPSVPAGAGL